MKGVSPLIATVMLVVIVVSMVALISGWLTTMITGTRETVSNRTSATVSCSGSSISIDSVYVTTNTTSGTAIVVVKNDGIVDELSITAANIFNSTGGNFSYNGGTLPISNFPRGSIVTLKFDGVSLATCGSFSQALVATNCVSARYVQKPTNC